MPVPPYPLFLDLRGRTVLVLGDGPAASRKAAFVARFGAVVRHATEFAPSDLTGCALALGADAPEADLVALSRAAQAAGIPVNVVDRPPLCSALSGAVVDRAPLVVAISSGGAAPVLARRVRSQIEALLPPTFGRLAELLDGLKDRLRSAFPNPEHRRPVIERVLDGPAAALALAGDMERARAVALAGLAAADAPPAGVVHLVAVGPGAADLLTLRAQRVMQEADMVVHDGSVPEAMLDMARRDALRVLDEAPVARLLALGRAGRRVARLAMGAMPDVFTSELEALRRAGIVAFVVPGAYCAVQPPSIDSAAPVNVAAASEQR